MGSQSQQVNMGVKLYTSCLLLSLLSCLTAATTLQDDVSEGRVLFSNYTSGLLALIPVNSTTYSLASLVIGGGFLLIATIYLLSSSGALGDLGLDNLAASQYNQYRAFNTEFPKKMSGMDLVSLVSSAIQIYSRLNKEDGE